MALPALLLKVYRLPEAQAYLTEDAVLSLPVPVATTAGPGLRFFVYSHAAFGTDGTIQVRAPHARMTLDRTVTRLISWQPLTTTMPPIIGSDQRSPAAGAARAQTEALQTRAIELTLALQAAMDSTAEGTETRAAAHEYIDLFERLAPPYLRDAYAALNPAFFSWLHRMGGEA